MATKAHGVGKKHGYNACLNRGKIEEQMDRR